MDKVADFDDHSHSHHQVDYVLAQEARAAQTESNAKMAQSIPPNVHDMWACLEGLDPCTKNLTSSQFTSLDQFYSFFDQFLSENYAPDMHPELTGEFESAFISHYHSFVQMCSFAAAAGNAATATAPPPLPTKLAPTSGSFQLFLPWAPSQPPSATLNPLLPLPPNKPVDPNVPWTIIGDKKKGRNKLHSFAVAVSGSNKPSNSTPSKSSQPPPITTTNCP